MGFIKEHKHLTHLEIESVYERENQLSRVIDELPNLIEITVKHLMGVEDVITMHTIIKIIEKNEKLMRLNLFTLYINEMEFKYLQEKFESDWNVVKHHYQPDKRKYLGLSFEKKD